MLGTVYTTVFIMLTSYCPFVLSFHYMDTLLLDSTHFLCPKLWNHLLIVHILKLCVCFSLCSYFLHGTYLIGYFLDLVALYSNQSSFYPFSYTFACQIGASLRGNFCSSISIMTLLYWRSRQIQTYLCSSPLLDVTQTMVRMFSFWLGAKSLI